MRENNMAIIADNIWKAAPEQNLHPLIRSIEGKSFRSCNVCILNIFTSVVDVILPVVREAVASYDANIVVGDISISVIFD